MVLEETISFSVEVEYFLIVVEVEAKMVVAVLSVNYVTDHAIV